jgi:hypothetical protein
MREQRDNPGIAFWSAVAGVALAVYGGAYWALLDPTPQWDRTEMVFLPGPNGEGRSVVVPADRARPVPNYRLVGAVGEALFAPAHWVDTRLRQSTWAAPATGEPRP